LALFHVLFRINAWRMKRPKWFNLLLVLCMAALCYPILGAKDVGQWLANWIQRAPYVPELPQPVPAVLQAVVGVVAGGVLSAVSRFVVIGTLYVPQVLGMNALGLVLARMRLGDSRPLTAQLAKTQGATERVKVICISGRELFRKPESPLYNLAMAGRLDVVMPRSSSASPTILARYNTYTKDVKNAEYPDVDTLVKEIAISKRFLVSHGNRVFEHDCLCIWRVTLFNDYCMVQCYVPNTAGANSFNSPCLVYRKHSVVTDGVVNSAGYYDTYNAMFNLLLERSEVLTTTEG
jgi:hypothetical protein